MNISARIRSLISSPMTAAEIHQNMPDIDMALIRGLIQRMVNFGIVNRIGSCRPYQYQVARNLKPQNRGFELKSTNVSQSIRDQLKIKQMTPAEIGVAVGIRTERAYQHMRDMIPGGYICKMGDGTYKWLKDPKSAMSPEEKERKREERNAKRRVGRKSHPAVSAPRRARAAVPKKVEPAFVPGQTVDEWIKSGGVIDRSPTVPKFERLTAEDIAATPFRPSSMQVRTNRAYVAG